MLVATSLTVSIDAFFAGFSAGIGNKNNNALLTAVAVITYLFCLAACMLGNALSNLLNQTATCFGAAILIVLGICNLLKSQQNTPSAMQCVATGVSVALDGAAAALSLSLQNVGNAIFTPILFAATHLFAVFLGEKTANSVHCAKANLLSAITLFVLAAIRLAEL